MSVQRTFSYTVALPIAGTPVATPFFNLEGFLAISTQFKGVYTGPTPPEWDSGTAYLTGDIVLLSGNRYIALSDNTGLQPDLFPVDWADYSVSGILTVQGTSVDSSVVGIPDDTTWTTITSIGFGEASWGVGNSGNGISSAFKYGRAIVSASNAVPASVRMVITVKDL